MSLICKPYQGIWRNYRVVTSDGFLVGLIDMRGSMKSDIDHPFATCEFDRGLWRNIKSKKQGVAWLEEMWEMRVRRWYAKL